MRIGNWHALFAALEVIITLPHRYSQQVWGRRTECGTVRCVAGWIAVMDGWAEDHVANLMNDIYSVSKGELTGIAVERAALLSLQLDPGVYGEIKPLTYHEWVDLESELLSVQAEDLVDRLFGGHHQFPHILEVVRDLARADGVTLSPVIVKEMERLGVPHE